MAIRQISVETEIDVRKYECLTSDKIEDYPVDCLAGSTMVIKKVLGGVPVGYALFDGTKWNSIKQDDDFNDALELNRVVSEDGNTYVLDMEDKRFKKFFIETESNLNQEHYIDLAGNVTTSGDANITITSDYLVVEEVPTPEIIVVAVLDTDTLPEIGGKIVDAINSNELVSLHYTASYLTIVDPEEVELDVYRVFLTANEITDTDATLNMALANDTSVGLTEIETSTELFDGETASVKELSIINVPRDAIVELVIGFIADVQSLTFPESFMWSTTTPESWVKGNTYEFKFMTRDGGTTWLAQVPAIW